ncbi:hypothetical protein F5Y16DRAFT_193751 [Xylariaceae sp. FL0255]|nr:hypothetical protein F5Y16DRAFT_193751 [Xylariaceae sp. FL0255]
MAATFQHYPYLTAEEFAETCHYLDKRYCQAALGQTRQQWRLDLHTALDTSATSYADLVTFVQITRPLDNDAVENHLASRLSNVGLEADVNMMETEETDKEVLPRHTSSRTRFPSSHVIYEIHLHPTYRVPCLWFSLRNLPLDESPLDIETVFRRLVPEQYKQILRGQGAMGSVSIEHHPITGLPTFFVHPCLLGDAMAPFDCSKEDYLLVWLGLVGACVGLFAPKELAILDRP